MILRPATLTLFTFSHPHHLTHIDTHPPHSLKETQLMQEVIGTRSNISTHLHICRTCYTSSRHITHSNQQMDSLPASCFPHAQVSIGNILHFGTHSRVMPLECFCVGEKQFTVRRKKTTKIITVYCTPIQSYTYSLTFTMSANDAPLCRQKHSIPLQHDRTKLDAKYSSTWHTHVHLVHRNSGSTNLK